LFLPAEIIRKKRDNSALSDQEINSFILGYTKGTVPDYQMSALLMAIFLRGLNAEEAKSLTKTMLNSGVVVNLDKIESFKVDKHSTGGVGDKTSLILAPIVAACGLTVPMISGRGLGHTGGTLDKLESIPGFNTQLSIEIFEKYLEKYSLCFIGQTPEICPADKKIYALRDVTATVECLPLICASIMSKKIAEGIDGLVLDVKFGSGAFMKTKAHAEELALALMQVGIDYGKKVTALLTTMNQPLGRFAGNSLEVEECLAILRGESFLSPTTGRDLYADTRELSLQLSAQMLYISGEYKSFVEAVAAAKNSLANGSAHKKFLEIVEAQSGTIEALPKPKHKIVIESKSSGFVSSFKTEEIGLVGVKIGAGRIKAEDKILPTAGVEFHVKISDLVKAGDPVFTLHGDHLDSLKSVVEQLLSCINLSEEKTKEEGLIWKTLT
jgi:pyrimidine-nucleoside phosphorylase